MITFRKEKSILVLIYKSEQVSNEWVYHEFDERRTIHLKNTFTLSEDCLFGVSIKQPTDIEQPVEFKVATKVDDYYKFSKDVLFIENNLFIHKDITLDLKTFVAATNISIFSRIDKIANEDVYVGGDAEASIPAIDFYSLVKNFPNTYELRKYAFARVCSVIRTYIDTKSDEEEKYHKYMNKKVSTIGKDLRGYFSDVEVYKYEELYKKLKTMLENEITYNENQWQDEIIQIILLLYPKYLHVFKEAPVKDTYSNKDRKIDLLLVDATGNTDLIEIKRPFNKCIVSNSTYRDNYIPLRDLSGTVMQVEKYIFYLNKWGKRGEEFLTKRYKNELPSDFSIKITNPNGIIIMGRDNKLSRKQKQDFEVIKRKYKHVIDIITYDDLLNRLRLMIEQWKKIT